MREYRQATSGPLNHGIQLCLGLRFSAAIITAAAVCMAAIGDSSPARAQPPAGEFANWKDVELSPQFKEVTTALKGGGPFNDTTRDFVSSVILPQLDKEENLSMLDDVRKKIRDRVLLAISSEAVFEQASLFVRDRLDEVARDAKADLLQRVNAMVFLGEMTDKGRNPWPPAIQPLAAAAGDATLDPAVRIAAVGGLSKHLARLSRMTGDQATATRTAVATTLPKLLPPPATDGKDAVSPRSHAASWLAARSFGLLLQVVNPIPPDMAARLVAAIDDRSWPFDVRVRAAVALGKTIGPDSGVNAQAVLASIRSLAIAALDADRLEGRRLTELRSFKDGGNAGPQAQMPGNAGMNGQPAEDGLSVAVCRRAAWRLYALGDAIVSDAKSGGLASVLGNDAAAAQQLASLLKDSGETLDAEPYGYVLLKALDALDPSGAKKRAGVAAPPVATEQPADAAPTTPNGDKPAPKPGDSPFGDSPF